VAMQPHQYYVPVGHWLWRHTGGVPDPCHQWIKRKAISRLLFTSVGSNFGKRKTKPRQRMEGHCLYVNYFSDEVTCIPKGFLVVL
jgi:hypothetical protein